MLKFGLESPKAGKPKPSDGHPRRKHARKVGKGPKIRSAKQCASDLAIEQRREQVMHMRALDMTEREIAVKLGVSPSVVHFDLEAIFLRIQESTDTAAIMAKGRMIERTRLLRRAVVQQALAPKIQNADGDMVQSPRQLDAVATMLRIDEREAKLLGLDAATRSELSGPNGGAIPLQARSALETKLDQLAGRLGAKLGGTPGAGPGGTG